MKRIGVVGCGLMGSGIAEVCARADLDVIVVEVDEAGLSLGQRHVEMSLARALSDGKLSGTQRERALNRIRFTTDLSELHDRQLVIEAVPEVEQLKLELFEQLDKVVTSDDAIFASTTSSIPIMKLAMSTHRPEKVIGLHFFNPAPVLPLVELVISLLTSPAVTERVERFASSLKKDVIRSQDRAGFIVNALLVPYLLSAIRMLESGFATAGDIDSGMVKGCAHPIGPLALSDLIGLDTLMAVAQSLYEEFKEALYAPPPLLSRMVEAGLLGRKTGRGFFDYGERRF